MPQAFTSDAKRVISLARGNIVVDFSREMVHQEHLAPKIEAELGFEFDSPHVNIDGESFPTEVLAIAKLDQEGILGRSGARQNDIVVGTHLVGELCAAWDAARGQEVTLTVVHGGDGPSLEERPKRTIRFVMPTERGTQITSP